MSRFIIIPNGEKFDLIPLNRKNTKRVINIPDGLFVDMGVFNRVEDQFNLKSLLCKLSRAEISRNSKGQINFQNQCLDGCYEDVILSCCDGNFKDIYGEFYSLLKNCGISF